MPAFPIQSAIQCACVRLPSAVAPLLAGHQDSLEGAINTGNHWLAVIILAFLSIPAWKPVFITCTERLLSWSPDCPGIGWPPYSVLQPPLCQPSSCLPALQSLTPGAPAANWTCSSLHGAICLGIPILDHRLLSTQLSTRPRCSPSGC